MNPRKNILSYIIWLIFSVYVLFMVAVCSFTLAERSAFSEFMALPYQKALLFLGVIIALVLLYIVVRIIAFQIRKYIPNAKGVLEVISIVCPVLILLGIVGLIAYYIIHNMPITLDNELYYRQAVVTGENTSFIVHGMSYLYVNVLHTLFMLFGNNPFSGIVLQIVLFFVMLVLVYIVCMHICGVIPACVAMAMTGLVYMQTFLNEMFSLTPELFYICMYFLGLCFISGIIKGFHEDKIHGFKGGILVYLLGIYIGYLIYLDIFSISLLFFMLGLVGMKEVPKKVAVLVNVISVVGVINGIIFSLIYLFIKEGIMPMEYLISIGSLYFGDTKIVMPCITPVQKEYAVIFLIVLFVGIVPGYVIQLKDRCTTWILCFFTLMVCQLFSINRLDYNVLITVFACIIAGVGFYGYIKSDSSEMVKEFLDELENEETAEDDMEIIEFRKTEEKAVTVEPGKPLDNPLPIPKKHAKKSIDFPFEVDEEKMEFDHKTDDEDDFDY